MFHGSSGAYRWAPCPGDRVSAVAPGELPTSTLVSEQLPVPPSAGRGPGVTPASGMAVGCPRAFDAAFSSSRGVGAGGATDTMEWRLFYGALI